MNNYNGVEGIVDRLIPTDRSFNFTDAAEQIVVGDDGTASKGISRISSNGIALPIDFADPTGSLTINSLGGNDGITILDLDGGAFGVIADGGAGDDTLMGSTENDTLTGGAGDDSLDGSGGTDVFRDDAVAGVQTLLAGSYDGNGNGNDTLVSIEQAELNGDSSNNQIDASGFTDSVTLRGNGGDDTLIGTTSDDMLEGGAGDDSIRGEAGADTIFGGADSDDVDGGANTDQVAGGTGDGAADAGDVVTGLAEEIDEAFQLTVPNWVKES